jgi:hypothetical protein
MNTLEEMPMASPPHYPDTDEDTGVGPDRESTTGTSRWVYVFWIIGIALILLMVVLHLTGTIGPVHH